MPPELLLLYPPSASHLQQLKALAPHWQINHTTQPELAKKLIETAEVVMGNHSLLQAIPYAKEIKWLQVASAGMDLILPGIPSTLSNIIITNASGVYDAEMAEHAMAMLLHLHRKINLLVHQQQNREWKRLSHLETLEGKQALILGWGGLAQAIAKRLNAFDMHITAVSTQAPVAIEKNIAWISNEKWREKIPQTDVFILALPATATTKNFVDRQAIELMKKSSLVINIGRASVTDEHALLIALSENRIAGLASDVWEVEPLPPDHLAWQLPNLLISPHTARSLESAPYRYENLFAKNFSNYIKGLPLLNVIQKEKGY